MSNYSSSYDYVSTKNNFGNLLALTLTLKAQRSVVIVFDAIEPVSYGT